MAEYTIQTIKILTDNEGNVKKDKFGNTQTMVKFTEHPETVYMAVKDPTKLQEGGKRTGSIIEGQYGYRFKGEAPAGFGGSPQQQSIASIATNDETKEILLAIYKAVTGEDYKGVQKETTPAVKPVTEAVQTSDTPPVEAYNEAPEQIDLSEISF